MNFDDNVTMRRLSLILTTAFIMGCTPLYKDVSKPIDRRVDDLIRRMTLDEMISQINLLPWTENTDSMVRAYVAKDQLGAVLKGRFSVSVKRSLQEEAIKNSRLGIPLMFHDDVIHGCMTLFPIPLAEACSWDVNQVEHSSAAIAREAAASGLQLTYAPMVDICRDGRWGRVMETSGEDPYLSAMLSAARVRGFQGSDLSDPYTIMACVKHFAGYANLTAGRDYANEEFSLRDLEELYLPPYRACIKENVGALMESYTMFDGIPVTYSKFLLTDVLRGELGYRGLLMTDWKTMTRAQIEGAVDTEEHSVQKAMDAGIQMDMTSECCIKHLKELCKTHKISRKTIRDAARACLYVKFQTGLFDDPYKYFDEDREAAEIGSVSIKAVALAAAQGSMVLLKNDGILPLDAGSRITVDGQMADATSDLMGAWICRANSNDVTSPRDALSEKFILCNDSKVAVVFIGEPKEKIGEAVTTGKLEITQEQIDVLRHYKRAGNKVVAVLFNGRPLCVGDILDNCDALLEAWYPGTMGAAAIASILSGEYNPSGKLVQTFPRHVGQVPIFYYYKRSFDHIWPCDIGDEPQFPFGYGLSYTKFEYSNLSVSDSEFSAGNPKTSVSVNITNTGLREGTEIVQLYISDLVSSVIPRERMLKDFARITIAPGQTKTVTFNLDASDFEIYDADHKWTVEPGEFRIEVGASSANTSSVIVRALP